jgi:hypothetical protein
MSFAEGSRSTPFVRSELDVAEGWCGSRLSLPPRKVAGLVLILEIPPRRDPVARNPPDLHSPNGSRTLPKELVDYPFRAPTGHATPYVKLTQRPPYYQVIDYNTKYKVEAAGVEPASEKARNEENYVRSAIRQL